MHGAPGAAGSVGYRMATGLIFGIVATLAPVMVRVIWPREDPYKGEEARLSSVSGIVVLGVFGSFLAVPGGALTPHALRRSWLSSTS